MERALITQYEARVDELLERLQPGNLALPPRSRVPLAMRGFGHVKIANVALARARGRAAAPARPAALPAPGALAQAGQPSGIAIVAR